MPATTTTPAAGPPRMTQAGYAALSQAVASIGHAVETMDDANLVGDLRDDAALLMERFSFALNTLPPNA